MQDGLTAVNDVATVKFGIGGLKYACEVLGYLPLQKEEGRRGEERRGEERRGEERRGEERRGEERRGEERRGEERRGEGRRGEERRGEERRGDLNEERYHGGEPRVPIPKATEGQRKEIKEVLDQFKRNQQK